jgi:uncharacterized protein
LSSWYAVGEGETVTVENGDKATPGPLPEAWSGRVDEQTAPTGSAESSVRRRHPLPRPGPLALFLVAVFGLGLVFYLAGYLLGGLGAVTGAPLPASALGFVCPALAAALVLRRRPGGIGRWMRDGLRVPRRPRAWWWVPAIGLMPLVMVVSYLVLEAAGVALPPPAVSWSAFPLMVAAFVVGAIGEELGWSGFAAEVMLVRHGAIVVGLVLGLAWALWHVVPFGQAGHGAAWIVGQCLFSVAFRLVLVQLYVAAGRCLVIPVVAHAGYNLAWAVFPVAGSYYDPAVAAMITAAVAGVLAVTGAGRRVGTARPA